MGRRLLTTHVRTVLVTNTLMLTKVSYTSKRIRFVHPALNQKGTKETRAVYAKRAFKILTDNVSAGSKLAL